MLNKLKKFMVITAAAVMLSAGFATAAPKEAHAAHWADQEMRWAFYHGIVTADLRDNLATRQDAWLMIFRANNEGRTAGKGYNEARNWVISKGYSDGSRGTNWITRDELVGMFYQGLGNGNSWSSTNGFKNSRNWGIRWDYYDGSRGNDFATRAEVISILHRVMGNR
ncbi:protein phosphatase 2C [Bacillus cereus group sp. BfR-BA-01523]|uniref:protein phosphatase 2C n=1 Tax=Bacillus cereus group sp. BfR-BA-01523 TaxID=2920371 RepID=UPI001F5A0334|nr:protein phosphatase 2C [Bacillus cereus group sp. BfR-BA-01523]